MYRRFKKSKSKLNKKGGNTYTLNDLKKAIEDKDIEEINKILEKNNDLINQKDDDGFTALHHACSLHEDNISYDVVKFLIEKGSDVNTESNHEFSILHTLVITINDFHDISSSPKNLLEIVELVLKNGVCVNTINDDYQTALYVSINSLTHNYELIKMLFKFGANPNMMHEEEGISIPLYMAYKTNADEEIIHLFIENGSYVPDIEENDIDSNEDTVSPDHVYDEQVKNQIELQDKVFSEKFRMDIDSKIDNLLECDIIILNHIKKLENGGIKIKDIVNARNEAGETILHYISVYTTYESLKYIGEKIGLYFFNQGDSVNWSPWHHAVRNGDIKFIKLIIDYYGDLRIRNEKETLIKTALTNVNYDVASLLIEYGVSWETNFEPYYGRFDQHSNSNKEIEKLKFKENEYHERSKKLFGFIENNKLNEYKYYLSSNKENILLNTFYTFDKNGNSLLHAASSLNREEFIKVILLYLPTKIDILKIRNDMFENIIDVAGSNLTRIKIQEIIDTRSGLKEFKKGKETLKRKFRSNNFYTGDKKSKKIFYMNTGERIGSYLGGKIKKYKTKKMKIKMNKSKKK